MEIQDKLFEKIKEASKKEEAKSFDAMENVWARVEEKLDKKEDKKIIPIWENKQFPQKKKNRFLAIIEKYDFGMKQIPFKQLAIASSIFLVFFIGYRFYDTENEAVAVNNTEKNNLPQKNRTELAQKNEIEKPIISEKQKAENNSETIVIEEDGTLAASPEIAVDEKAYVNQSIKSEEIVKNYPKVAKEEQHSALNNLPKVIGPNLPIAQNNVVTGIVVDATGAPVPGSQVLIKGKNKGTVTNANGEFSIKAEKFDKLLISSIGYKSEEQLVTDFKNNNIVLNEDVQTLSEIVVTGYATQQKRMVTGSAIVLDKNYKPAPNNIQQQLQGRIAGVAINQSKKESRKSKREFEETIKIKNDKSNGEKNSSEEYDQFIENQFESPKIAPLSTFSIDVDNASYTNVRRFINNGQKVPKDAVRVEEMVNFFKYNYPQPIDNQPFSINSEYSNCPWNTNHKLLKVGLQGKSIPTDKLPASNLVFLIDVSGSMSDENKLPLLKQSMKILVNELRKEDKVSIVVYAGAAGLVLKPTSGDDKKTIINSLEKLNAGGSTAGGEGIELAYKTAEEYFILGGNNRVIIATDGDFNVGVSSKGDIQNLIEEKRQSGVFLTCLGFGMGNYKDVTLETLADKGNGNYAYIDNIQEANRFLGKEFKGSMFAIAKDVKIQIEFNPNHVAAYRLIGYENRKLKAEDFKNDKIDAGELGSGHIVTALYEIIPSGTQSDFIQPDLKYTKAESKQPNLNNELATIKFRYKKPDENKSIEIEKVIDNKDVTIQNASPDYKLSVAVAWFGLKLRDSKLISDKSIENIIKLTKQGIINDNDGYKAEFLRLVETVK